MTEKTRARTQRTHSNASQSTKAVNKAPAGATSSTSRSSAPPPEEETRLSPLQSDLIERFGDIYESYGLQRLKGLLVGLLLTQDAPLSLDDMVELLGRSKGPISTTVRELSQVGLIHPVDGPVSRRDYYTAADDVFYINFKFNMETVRRNLQTSQTFLERMEAQPSQADPVTRRNLELMRHFYQLMFEFYQEFGRQWELVKQSAELTPVENPS